MKSVLAAAILGLLVSSTAAAQPPDQRLITPAQDSGFQWSMRPFVMGTVQAFAATNTFEAAFGQSHESFFGGGAQVLLQRRFLIEIGLSRFRKTGQRAFRFDNQNFGLGLPLTAEITPLEVTGGYRFEQRPEQRVVPYASAGFGSYRYRETSPSSDPGENLDVRHSGFVVSGGIEVRLQRWVRVAVDETYTHVPGILGKNGVSQAAGEDNLGGIAARFKVVVGR